MGMQLQLQKKILGGPKNRLSKSKTAQGAPVSMNQRKRAAMLELDGEDDRKTKQ
jgi:hypothetical protein